jgi:hypothetical protein
MTDRDRDFIREVDEAVRQDQYKRLWDQYGVYALAALVLVVAGVAGYKGWAYWREREAGQAGAKFSQALAVSDAAKANEIFTALATDGPKGYRILSRFQLAAAAAMRGTATRRWPTTTRSLAIRASTTSCAAMPRCKPLRSVSTRPTMPR